MAEAGNNSRQFRAEVRKVLHILTNSLYTNREIFLRELVSNASDALDKLRYHMNRGESPSLPDLPLEISISLDKDAKVLTIADTGLGMTAEELAENLGTIARSGSEQFLADVAAENASKTADSTAEAASGEESADAKRADAANIIGRFGVGFYSVFMVASKVEVTSRPAFGDNAEASVWISDGLGTFTIEPATGDGPQRGTVIKAWLKDDAAEFAEKFRVESVIRKHSAFVPFPVLVEGEQVNDGKWLSEVLREYQRIGFLTAIDDFGAGFAGLNLLADFQPDIVKLNMALVRGIDANRPRRAIVAGVSTMCRELGIRVIAEGIETGEEMRCLRDLGIELMQGYWFSRPLFEQACNGGRFPWPA